MKSRLIVLDPNNAQDLHKPALPLSSRALKKGVAIHSPYSVIASKRGSACAAIHSLESSFAKVDSRARAVDSMDCHDLPSKSRNDKAAVDCHATASAVPRNDKNNAICKVDSRARAVDSMDCHDLPSKSRNDKAAVDCHATASAVPRNDKNNAICKKVDSRENTKNVENSTQDSRIFDKNAQKVSESAKDSRILELQIGVFQGSQGDKTSGLSTKRADEIHDFSPKQATAVQGEAEAGFFRKAESTSQAATPPNISIIVPVFNTQPYITRCLQSLITQTLRDIEIIIIDDCGSDGAMEIARSFAARDPRIHILRNPTNLGLLHTRCVGASLAQGEYILYVDSDDYIKPNLCGP